MTPVAQLFEQFVRERTYIQNVTPKTLEWYRTAWQRLHAVRAVAHRVGDAPVITRATSNSSSCISASAGSARSRATAGCGLNSFCGWLHEQGVIPNPCGSVHRSWRNGCSGCMTQRRSADFWASARTPTCSGESTRWCARFWMGGGRADSECGSPRRSPRPASRSRSAASSRRAVAALTARPKSTL